MAPLTYAPPAMIPRLTQGQFYGRTLRHSHAAGFRLSESRYRPDSQLPRHTHELPYFGFVLGGTYTESYGRDVRVCRPSTLVFHPAGEQHAQRFDGVEVHLFRIEMGRGRVQDVARAGIGLESPAHSRNDGVRVLAHRLYQEFRAPDAVSPLAIEGLALELIAAIARHPRDHGAGPRTPPRWLLDAHDLIKSRYADSWTLGGMARAAGVHPVTLAREFHRHFGCTIGATVRRERIAFACREIRKPDAQLAEVARASGFYDQSHFGRTFKRVTGVTPARYRAAFRPH